ncbi:hypothetical protein NU219Hw_g5789t1 [Hortaea werneckii]
MAPHKRDKVKRPMTDICQACTSTGMRDCDMRAARAAGRERCSNCEQKRRDQTGYQGPPTGYQAPPTGYGMPSFGFGMPSFGFGMPSMGYGMPPMGWGMPTMGYGMPSMGYGMPSMSYGTPQMPPAGAQFPPSQTQSKRKRENDLLDKEIRDVQNRIEKQRRLNSLRSSSQTVARSPEASELDRDREANRARRETEAQRRDRDRAASEQRGQRQQFTFGPPNPSSMVDYAVRRARLERENKSRTSDEATPTQREQQPDDTQADNDGEAAALQTMHERQDHIVGSRPQTQPEQERDDSDSDLDTWHDAPEH